MKRFSIVITLIGILISSRVAFAQTPTDLPVAALIKQQLVKPINGRLYYPKSVARFYRRNNYQPVWLNVRESKSATWKAMLTLDCVLQFGLSHDDYHQGQLSYDFLHDLIDKPKNVTDQQKADFDVLLTDAMITLINHLHYGKLNPDYGALRLDTGLGLPLAADENLRQMLTGQDLFASVFAVQPKSKAYAALQIWMNKWKGQYLGDCYEIPDAEVRRVAINMERLRWADINDSTAYLQVNIPTYQLIYHLPDTNRTFKVIVGKPGSPTPVLQSQLSYFTTAPDWQVPAKIFKDELLPKAIRNISYLQQNKFTLYDREGIITDVDTAMLKEIAKHPANYYARQSAGCDNALGLLIFRFANQYDIYLHDTPEQQLFARQNRALSHGCIRVQKAVELAQLLLANDGQAAIVKQLNSNIARQKRQNYGLNKPLPIKITYVTCDVVEGQLVTYNDIYSLDQRLETALYHLNEKLSSR